MMSKEPAKQNRRGMCSRKNNSVSLELEENEQLPLYLEVAYRPPASCEGCENMEAYWYRCEHMKPRSLCWDDLQALRRGHKCNRYEIVLML